MKLSANDRRVLVAAQLNSRAPALEIARAAGLKSATVRRSLARLVERGVLTPLAFINVYRLGLTDYGIYFCRERESRAARAKFLKGLAQSDRISWLTEIGGEFDFALAVYVRNLADLQTYLDFLGATYGSVFAKKSIAARVHWQAFPCKYLSKISGSVPSVKAGGEVDKGAIDDTDHEILKHLARAGDASLRALARTTGLPHSSVAFRVARLEKRGIIEGYTWRVHSDKFGASFHRILVSERGTGPSFASRLQQYCRSHPNVTGLVKCVGSWDYELRAEVMEAREISGILDGLHECFGAEIEHVRVCPVFDILKQSNYPFADNPCTQGCLR